MPWDKDGNGARKGLRDGRPQARAQGERRLGVEVWIRFFLAVDIFPMFHADNFNCKDFLKYRINDTVYPASYAITAFRIYQFHGSGRKRILGKGFNFREQHDDLFFG
jgi:hypothetical protein